MSQTEFTGVVPIVVGCLGWGQEKFNKTSIKVHCINYHHRVEYIGN